MPVLVPFTSEGRWRKETRRLRQSGAEVASRSEKACYGIVRAVQKFIVILLFCRLAGANSYISVFD